MLTGEIKTANSTSDTELVSAAQFPLANLAGHEVVCSPRRFGSRWVFPRDFAEKGQMGRSEIA
jgi:hypothetical protein